MQPGVYNFWDSLGISEEGDLTFVCVEELDWEALFNNQEHCTTLFDVAIVEALR